MGTAKTFIHSIVMMIAMGIIVTGCVKSTTKITDSCRNKNSFQEKVGQISVVGDKIYEFDYKNHHYIWFEKSFNKYGYAGVVHDPDCYCHHNQTVQDEE